jgi:hypothetical protein
LQGLTEEEKVTHLRERERAEANRRKEVQIRRMDEIKRFMIADIMRRGNSAGQSRGHGTDFNFYDEICFGVREEKVESQVSEEEERFKRDSAND